MKDQGLRVGFVLNTVDEAMVSQLQHELGVAPYLLTAQCQLTDSIYSTTENNGKSECGFWVAVFFRIL